MTVSLVMLCFCAMRLGVLDYLTGVAKQCVIFMLTRWLK
jgi:hypothetical protein